MFRLNRYLSKHLIVYYEQPGKSFLVSTKRIKVINVFPPNWDQDSYWFLPQKTQFGLTLGYLIFST